MKQKDLVFRLARGLLPLVWAALAAGCVSQARPLSVRDIQYIVDARREATPWRLDVPIDSRPVVVLTVLFDGTKNDRAHVHATERPTIIAHIAERIREDGRYSAFVHYYAGTGTSGGRLTRLWDAAVGASTAARAEVACRAVRDDIRASRQQHANPDIRVFVAGFSRGAASARHFMNLLERDCRAQDPPSDSGVRSYALLFDTVATGQRGRLQLGIPSSADRILNFVSLDERRIFFRPDLDQPRNDGRISTVPLPGVHSDVGDGYSEGVGGETRYYVDALLYQMGLIRTETLSVPVDYTLQGTNDSRWPLEKILGITPAGSPMDHGRRPFRVSAAPMSGERAYEWAVRSGSLGTPRVLKFYERHDALRPAFDVRRDGDRFSLKPVGVQLNTDAPPPTARDLFQQPRIVRCGAGLALRYKVAGGAPHVLVLPRRVSDHIRDHATTRLEVGVVSRKAGDQLWWLVDDVDVAPMKHAGGSTSTSAGAAINCAADPSTP